MTGQWVEIEVEKLVPAGWNYKEENEFMQTQLENNIKRIGQVENIMVRELETGFYEVVNGNHRLQAFKKLGKKKVMTYNFGKIHAAEAERIAIETNETKFRADNVKLSESITRQVEHFSMEELKSTMPYTVDELENYKNLRTFNWDKPIGEAEEAQDHESGSDSAGSPKSNAGDSFRTLVLNLPSYLAEDFEARMKHIKKLMYPEELPEHVSDVPAIQAVLQILAETEDQRFTAKEK